MVDADMVRRAVHELLGTIRVMVVVVSVVVLRQVQEVPLLRVAGLPAT
jgi:hypothetical protein